MPKIPRRASQGRRRRDVPPVDPALLVHEEAEQERAEERLQGLRAADPHQHLDTHGAQMAAGTSTTAFEPLEASSPNSSGYNGKTRCQLIILQVQKHTQKGAPL